jgi:hypothetical protein
MATETPTKPKTHDALLKAQRAHSDKYKGQPESQGGRDYPATDVERLAGTIRLSHYESLIAEASTNANQDDVDDLMEEYHAARLKVAQKRLDKEEQ